MKHDFKPIKLIIAGSRPKTMRCGHTMMENICRHFNFHPVTVKEVVSGCAQGVDEMGMYWAWEQEIKVKKSPANWEMHGKAAGPIRNKQMAKYADALLLVWDGESKGSLSMKTEMLKLNKPVHEVIMRTHNATN